MLEEKIRKEVVELAAKLMIASAQTAPKSKGEDSLEVMYLSDFEEIAKKMEELAEKTGDKNFVRDANSLRKSDGLILLGIYGERSIGMNCGACGFESCKEFAKAERKEVVFKGPSCAFKLLDLGIAIGSAVKLGAMIGVDSRVMYRIGAAAKLLGISKADVVMGIPLASLSKSPFFDR
ncbi:Protein of unknown function DUF2148 [Ferroglobus placidus DSM 10642]|uniref:4Fe-4S domain-containing protein n=1 Tax=Ferroglobus placidus (strain DSM 10642 / AEDII12DO) TaxID=589924 RepID=D3S094_FERPA|nr:DUF2148 domain-containing protein [Ferroglobus placidus]ADC66157.1 Protein of unknown function DUF2148 [Ferroglobus placidus DSM 10642]